jgi:IclR-like helix-turn-helix domain-containing protein
MSSVIEDLKRLEDRILARIRELEANVAELEQLREVAARLGILEGDRRDGGPATRRTSATARSRRRVRHQATATGARPGGARSATGPEAERATRRERVLEVVAVEPGISVREIVAQLGVNRTSLYPVVRALMSDGLLHKDGRGLWLASR